MVARPSRSSSSLDQDCVDSGGSEHRRLDRISRSADGRFVLARADSRSSSLSSGSDDGGFLSHPSFSAASWSRRPLLISAAAIRAGDNVGGTTAAGDDCVDGRDRRPIVATAGPQTAARYRGGWAGGSDRPRPAPARAADRTLRSVHEQYSQQLPSLRVIHEENQRTLMRRQQQQQQQLPSPRYHPNPGRFRSKHMRYARSAPELTTTTTSAAADAATGGGGGCNERSPESRSSSSGFGSKNTNNSSSLLQREQREHNATDDGWPPYNSFRPLPPYKPPPPPPPPPPSLFYANERWLDFASPVLPSPSSHSSASKPLSVDDQYEFDPVLFPVSPTPTADIAVTRTPTTPSPSRSRTPTQLKMKACKHENVEARLQAMKEEFHAYKRRQAEMARMGYVESAC